MAQSDIIFDAIAFTAAVSPEVAKTNELMKTLGASTAPWWEIGAERYREMRRNGEAGIKPEMLNGIPAQIPSRDPGRSIPIRLMRPDRDVKIKSVIMYIHGGGWVLSAEDLFDHLIKDIANGSDSLVVSTGYRLAPEDPWPAGPNDCNDVADWLVDNAVREYGASLQYIVGESAGGNLTMTTFIHLHSSRPEHILSGLMNYYGCYDLSRLPQAHHYSEDVGLTITGVKKFVEAYCPGLSGDELKNPAISPLYQDFRGFKLPPAFFLCGTNDVLHDDSAFMHIKWVMAGGDSRVKFYPGGPHGFMSMPRSIMPLRDEGLKYTFAFIKETLR